MHINGIICTYKTHMCFHKHNAQLAIKLRRAQNHEKWVIFDKAIPYFGAL